MSWRVDVLTDALGTLLFQGGLDLLARYWVETAVNDPMAPDAAQTVATLVRHVVRDTRQCHFALVAMPLRPPEQPYATVMRLFAPDADLAVLLDTLAEAEPDLAEILFELCEADAFVTVGGHGIKQGELVYDGFRGDGRLLEWLDREAMVALVALHVVLLATQVNNAAPLVTALVETLMQEAGAEFAALAGAVSRAAPRLEDMGAALHAHVLARQATWATQNEERKRTWDKRLVS